MIYIHKGDDTDFNDNSFLTFNIVTEKDLTGWQAKFILNGLEKTFEDITSKSFELHYSDEETSQFKLGKTTNELRLIDEEGKIKTVAKNIDISVTNEVIENESQLINLPILKDEGIDINISLASNSGSGGGTANHFELLYRDMANQHPISAITNLQETLDNKANKDEIPSVDGFITNDELENKGYLTEHQDISNLATKDELNAKQDVLVDGTNIKTINNQPILGQGNINIETISSNIIPDNSSLIASYPMPSDIAIDLTLGETGSTYIAPASGYFIFQSCTLNTDIASVTLSTKIGTKTMDGALTSRGNFMGKADQWIYCFVPAKAGQTVFARYKNINTEKVFLRFIYAEGNQP